LNGLAREWRARVIGPEYPSCGKHFPLDELDDPVKRALECAGESFGGGLPCNDGVPVLAAADGHHVDDIEGERAMTQHLRSGRQRLLSGHPLPGSLLIKKA
jgi:hypothetical protein